MLDEYFEVAQQSAAMSYDISEVRAKLFKAFRLGNFEKIQQLLYHVCQADNSDENAVKCKYIEINFLVLKRKDAEGRLMIQIALLTGKFDIVRYLIEFWPNSINGLSMTLDSLSLYH